MITNDPHRNAVAAGIAGNIAAALILRYKEQDAVDIGIRMSIMIVDVMMPVQKISTEKLPAREPDTMCRG